MRAREGWEKLQNIPGWHNSCMVEGCYICRVSCSTHKIQYTSRQLAEDALLDQHIYKGFLPHEGPQDVYECQICDHWHMTSRKGPRNERLQAEMDSGELKRKQEVSKWESGFR